MQYGSQISPSCNEIAVLPHDSQFRKFLAALKQDVKASWLYKELLQWFKAGRSKKFYYRFTGKDARLLSHNFMFLIHSLSVQDDSVQAQLRLVTLAFCCIELQDAVSLFSRIIVMSVSEVDKLSLQYSNLHVTQICQGVGRMC